MTIQSNETQPKRKSPHSGTLMASLIVIGLLVAFGIQLYSHWNRPSTTVSAAIDGLPGTAAVARPAPDLPVMTIQGRSVRLSELRGKVVLLDFWATWCQYCRQEIPHLVRLTEKYKSKGLEVVALTIENPQTDTEKIRLFMNRFGINYTVGFATDDLFTKYIGPGQQPIPQTLLFDRQGRLMAHWISFNPRTDPQQMESAITRLL